MAAVFLRIRRGAVRVVYRVSAAYGKMISHFVRFDRKNALHSFRGIAPAGQFLMPMPHFLSAFLTHIQNTIAVVFASCILRQSLLAIPHPCTIRNIAAFDIHSLRAHTR